jgi:hypothetical protein
MEDVNTYYVEINEIWKWAKLIGFNIKKKTEQCIEDKKNTKKKYLNQNEHHTILARTEHEISAEVWVKLYFESVKSSGVIHSVRTGKHAKFIMCNIRTMNICKEVHKDYFNDSTIYVNLDEKQFSVRCNRIPCNKKRWVWKPMI